MFWAAVNLSAMYPYIWQGSATVQYQGGFVAVKLSLFVILWSALGVATGYFMFLKCSKENGRIAQVGAFLGGLISMLALPLF